MRLLEKPFVYKKVYELKIFKHVHHEYGEPIGYREP